MYITYEVEQSCHVSPFFGSFQKCDNPDTRKSQRLSTVPKSEFMPTWLVRVSDMTAVRGNTVTNEGYCAVSYSWSWSGDMILDIKNSRAVREDHGKHKIIYPANTTVQQENPMDEEEAHTPTYHTTYVKFEAIIQQICKDFGVRYLWFDQMCINQGDKKEKLREIRQMHRIYSNAYCTLVLIPEFHTLSTKETVDMGLSDSLHIADLEDLYTSEWVKRLWTFEEGLLSPRMLFVGRNVHMWWSTVPETDSYLDLFCQERKRLQPQEKIKQEWRGYNVSTVLYHAHLRTSTKEHDRAFALANLFPHIMDGISVSYDQPVLDLMVQFYGHLAMMDLSILCFHECTDGYKERGIKNMSQITADATEKPHDIPIRQHDLPSWTGINGEHLRIDLGPDAPADHLQTTFTDYSIHGRFMHITCMGLTSVNDHHPRISDDNALVICDDDLLSKPDPSDYSVDKIILQSFELAISVRLPGHQEDKIVGLGVTNTTSDANIIKQGSEQLRLLSHFIPIDKENLFWCPVKDASKPYAWVEFNLTEQDQVGTEYVILSEVSFNTLTPDLKYFPVIKKDEENYKAIGTCTIRNHELLLSEYSVPRKTYIIE